MRGALIRLLHALQEAGTIGTPAVLIPALSIEDLPRLAPGDRHVAYRTFAPGDPIPALAGSEAFVGNLLRDLAGARPRSGGQEAWLPPTTKLEEARRRRIRSIVFVADYAGTGNQLVRFAEMFPRNATLRSWRSFGLLRMHAVAYAASLAAMRALELSPAVDKSHAEITAPSFATAQWSPDERGRIEELCRKYAMSKRGALGYRSGMGLFVTDVSVPNNIPAILWQEGGGWRPFFSGRRVYPEFALELSGYVPPRDLGLLVGSVGQRRLAARLASPARPTRHADLLAVLALVEAGTASAYDIAGRMQTTIEHAGALLGACSRLGFVGPDGLVSPAGLVELRFAKRARRAVRQQFTGSAEPYYPRHLR